MSLVDDIARANAKAAGITLPSTILNTPYNVATRNSPTPQLKPATIAAPQVAPKVTTTPRASLMTQLTQAKTAAVPATIVAAPRMGLIGSIQQKMYEFNYAVFGQNTADKMHKIANLSPGSSLKGGRIDVALGSMVDSLKGRTGAILTSLSMPGSIAYNQGKTLRQADYTNVDIKKEAKFEADGFVKNIQDPEWYADRIPKLVGGIVPDIALRVGAAPAALTASYSTFVQDITEGGGKNNATTHVAAGVMAALDYVSLGTVTAPLKKVLARAVEKAIAKEATKRTLVQTSFDVLKNGVKSYLAEGTTEAAQEAIQGQATSGKTNTRDVLTSFYLGGLLGAGLNVAFETPEVIDAFKKAGKTPEDIKKSKQDAETLINQTYAAKDKNTTPVVYDKSASQTSLPVDAVPTIDTPPAVTPAATVQTEATTAILPEQKAVIDAYTPQLQNADPKQYFTLVKQAFQELNLTAEAKTVKAKGVSAVILTVTPTDTSLAKKALILQIGNTDTPIGTKTPDFIVNLQKNKSIPFDQVLQKINAPQSAPTSKKIVSELKKFQKNAVNMSNEQVAQEWNDNPFLHEAIINELESRGLTNPEIVDLVQSVPSTYFDPTTGTVTQADQVAASVAEGPKSIKQIAEETKIKEPNIRRILGVGAKEGTFERVDTGVYKLSINGKDLAYVEVGSSTKVLPRLASEGFKADMVFLDIPYDTPAVKGGNRGVGYALISVDDFSIVLDAVQQIARTPNSPIIHMYSQADSGMKAMQKYNDLFLQKGFKPVGKGELQKTFKDGSLVTNVRGEVSKPEGIIVFTKSGELDKDLGNLNFKLVRPKGYQTEKPAEMIKQMIAMTTEEGDVVLDPFAGSGVVGSEATKLGRGSYSVEMNPDVAQNITMPRIESAVPPVTKPAGPKKSLVSQITEGPAQSATPEVAPPAFDTMNPTPTQRKMKKGKVSKEEMIKNNTDIRSFQEDPLIKDQDYTVTVDMDVANIGANITYAGNVGAFLDRVKVHYVVADPNGKQRVQTSSLGRYVDYETGIAKKIKISDDLKETGLQNMLDRILNEDATSTAVTKGLSDLKNAIKNMELMAPVGQNDRVNGQYKLNGKLYEFTWSKGTLEPDDARIGTPMTHDEVQAVIKTWEDLANGTDFGDAVFHPATSSQQQKWIRYQQIGHMYSWNPELVSDILSSTTEQTNPVLEILNESDNIRQKADTIVGTGLEQIGILESAQLVGEYRRRAYSKRVRAERFGDAAKRAKAQEAIDAAALDVEILFYRENGQSEKLAEAIAKQESITKSRSLQNEFVLYAVQDNLSLAMDVIEQARTMEGQLHVIKTLNDVTKKSPEAGLLLKPNINSKSSFSKSIESALFGFTASGKFWQNFTKVNTLMTTPLLSLGTLMKSAITVTQFYVPIKAGTIIKNVAQGKMPRFGGASFLSSLAKIRTPIVSKTEANMVLNALFHTGVVDVYHMRTFDSNFLNKTVSGYLGFMGGTTVETAMRAEFALDHMIEIVDKHAPLEKGQKRRSNVEYIQEFSSLMGGSKLTSAEKINYGTQLQQKMNLMINPGITGRPGLKLFNNPVIARFKLFNLHSFTNMTNAVSTTVSSLRNYINTTHIKELALENQKALDALVQKQNSYSKTNKALRARLQAEIDMRLQQKLFFETNPKQSVDQILNAAKIILPYFFGGLILQQVGVAVMQSFGNDDDLTPEEKEIRDAYIANTVQQYAVNLGIDPVTNIANTIFGIGSVAATTILNPIFLAVEEIMAFHDGNTTQATTSAINFFKKYPGLNTLADIGARIAVEYGKIDKGLLYLSPSGKFEPSRVMDAGEAFFSTLLGNGLKINENVALDLMKKESTDAGLETTSWMARIANSFNRNMYFLTQPYKETIKQGVEIYERFKGNLGPKSQTVADIDWTHQFLRKMENMNGTVSFSDALILAGVDLKGIDDTQLKAQFIKMKNAIGKSNAQLNVQIDRPGFQNDVLFDPNDVKEYLNNLKKVNPEGYIQALNIFLALHNVQGTGTREAKDWAELAAGSDNLQQKKNIEAALAAYYLETPAAATAMSDQFAFQFREIVKGMEEGKNTPEYQEKLLDTLDAQAAILEMALPEVYEAQKLAFARALRKEGGALSAIEKLYKRGPLDFLAQIHDKEHLYKMLDEALVYRGNKFNGVTESAAPRKENQGVVAQVMIKNPELYQGFDYPIEDLPSFLESFGTLDPNRAVNPLKTDWIKTINSRGGDYEALQYPGHVGVDLTMKYGEPVTTPIGGKITMSYTDKWLGNTMVIEVTEGPYKGNTLQFAHLNEDASGFKKVGDIIKSGEAFASIGATGNILTQVAGGIWRKPTKEEAMANNHGVHLHIQTRDENGKLRTHAETAAWLQGKKVTASAGGSTKIFPSYGGPVDQKFARVYVDENLAIMTGVTDENLNTLPDAVIKGQYENLPASEFQSRIQEAYGTSLAQMRPVVEKKKKTKQEDFIKLTPPEKTLTPKQTEVKLSDVAQQLTNPRRKV